MTSWICILIIVFALQTATIVLFAIILQFNLFYHYFPDILKGSVGILNNYNLCHIKTIQWDEIITDAPQSRYVYVYNFKEPERDCSPCHESCEVSNSCSCRARTALYLHFNFKLFFPPK